MRTLVGLTLVPFVLVAGCGDDTTAGGADMGVADMAICIGGGPVSGAADSHCGGTFVTVDPNMCDVDAGDSSGGGGDDFGDTMYNSSGNDDDCKYFVSFTVAGGACVGADTFFTVTLEDATTKAPITGAKAVRPEVFETSTALPVSTAASTTTEMSGGVYKIGPVQFKKSGNYTVRFHFFEDCTDTETSPHGHAAFFINVP